MPDGSKTHSPKAKLLIFTLVCFRLALLGGWGNSNNNIKKKSHFIIKFISYILRSTHKKIARTIRTKYTNKPISKGNDRQNTPFVQSETRAMVLPIGGQQARLFVENKKKIEEEVPRFVLPENWYRTHIGKQENVGTRAKSDRDVTLPKTTFFKGR